MARERRITRTITVTTYNVLAVKLVDQTVANLKVEIPSADTLSKDKLEKAINRAVPNGHAVALITEVAKDDVLYSMSEEMFLQYATVEGPGR